MKAYVLLEAMTNSAKVIRVMNDVDVMQAMYATIGCDTVQLIPLYPDRIPKGYAALCDEDVYGKEKVFNPLASWLYGADSHGQIVTRNAVIIKSIPEDFDFMTVEEARKIAKDLNDRAEEIFDLTVFKVFASRQ